MAIILWNKKYTETLAETLKRFRLKKSEYKDEKITYAGRLDPMAEGLLILLTGNDVYKKEDFLGLDKIYEIDFICGPNTDSYDVLGLVNAHSGDLEPIEIKKLKKTLKKYPKKYEQAYPPYSSKPVNGKALFTWARENRLDEIEIPHKEVEIYDIKYIRQRQQNASLFKEKIRTDINSVKGDFRQKDSINTWYDYFGTQNTTNIYLYTIRVHASSGTYMRSLIQNIGGKLGINLCTVKIRRLSIGKSFFLKDIS